MVFSIVFIAAASNSSEVIVTVLVYIGAEIILLGSRNATGHSTDSAKLLL